MFTYFERLQKSFITRSKTPFPSIKMVIIFVNGLVFTAMILALKIHPEGNYAYHFGEEIGLITAISAVFLSIAAGLAGSAWYFSAHQQKTHKAFWFLTMVAFGFLAIDEQMQIHEKLGRLIKNNWLGPSQIFRNWNDAIVILYGIGALLFLAIFLPTILSYPKVLEILAASMLFYIFHTAIDALTVEKTHFSVVLEESCKVFSSANFAVAMFVGLLGNVIAFRRPGHQTLTH